MLMPERSGYKVEGGWSAGTDAVNGNTITQTLVINEREWYKPEEYIASKFIEFVEGFESLGNDEFEAFIADETNTPAGNPSGSGGENNSYRYGFNGKENDDEVKGVGNQLDFGDRAYDPRLGRWWTIDPLRDIYTSLSAYSFGANNPINVIDENGDVLKDKNGNIIATATGELSAAIPILVEAKFDSKGTMTESQIVERVYEKVYIYADDGTKIEARRLVSAYVVTYKHDSKGMTEVSRVDASTKGYEAVSDCHGYTFAKGRLWIDDDFVEDLLTHDGYERNVPEQRADAVLFKRNDGNIVHSAVRNSKGLYDNDAGIMSLEKNKSLNEASRGLYKDDLGSSQKMTKKNYEFINKKEDDKVVDIKTGEVNGGVRYVTEEDVQSALNKLGTSVEPIKRNAPTLKDLNKHTNRLVNPIGPSRPVQPAGGW